MKKASLILLLRNGMVLLGEKKKGAEIGSGKLNGSGGKLEEGETMEACAIRENEEEFGVRVSDLEKVAVITCFANGTPDFEVHVFTARAWDGEPHETPSMFAPAWYPINDLPFDRMHSADVEWMPDVLAGKKFNANIYYRDRGEGYERMEPFPFSG